MKLFWKELRKTSCKKDYKILANYVINALWQSLSYGIRDWSNKPHSVDNC